MSTFDEAAHPRERTGKFSVKGYAEAEGGTDALLEAKVEKPIERISLNQYNRPARELMTMRDEGYLDLDQDYQRGEVWGLKRRRELIRSAMRGVPIPSIILNDRRSAGFSDPAVSGAKAEAYAVVDGKQRTTTLLAFYDSKFSIPASWLPDDEVAQSEDENGRSMVRYSGLTPVGRRRMSNRLMIPISEGTMKNLAEERELFDVLNYGGLAQGEIDDDLIENEVR